MNLLSNETMKEIKNAVKDLATEALDTALADFKRLNRYKDYMNAQEACTYLGISYNTLQKMRHDGLRVLDLGGRTIYSKKAIEEYFNLKGE